MPHDQLDNLVNEGHLDIDDVLLPALLRAANTVADRGTKNP